MSFLLNDFNQALRQGNFKEAATLIEKAKKANKQMLIFDVPDMLYKYNDRYDELQEIEDEKYMQQDEQNYEDEYIPYYDESPDDPAYPEDDFYNTPPLWDVTVKMEAKMINENIGTQIVNDFSDEQFTDLQLRTFTETFTFDHEPTREEVLKLAKQWRSRKIAEFQQNPQYGAAIKEFSYIIADNPVERRLDGSMHRELIRLKMYDNENKTCVIDLIESKYNYNRKSLIEYFGEDTNAENIYKFCNQEEIPMYCYDQLGNELYRISFSNNKRALMFVIANNHIYEINDLSMRKALLRGGKFKSDKTYEASQVNLENISTQIRHLKKGKYVTKNELTSAFEDIFKNDRNELFKTKWRDNECIKISWDGITVKREENYDTILAISKKYTGQSLADALLTYVTEKFNSFHIDDYKSTYNMQTYDVIKSVMYSAMSINFTDLEKKDSVKTYVCDAKRFYSNICKNYSLPTITSNDVFVPFDGKLKPDYWYIIDPSVNELLFGGCCLVPYEMLNATRTSSVLTSIKYQIKTKPISLAFVADEEKHIANSFIGLFGKTQKPTSNRVFSTSKEEIGILANLTKTKISYQDLPYGINGEVKRVYHTIQNEEAAVDLYPYRLLHMKIILMGRYLVYKKYLELKRLNLDVIQIKTDGIMYVDDGLQDTSKLFDNVWLKKDEPRKVNIHKSNLKYINKVPNLSNVPNLHNTVLSDMWDADDIAEQINNLSGACILGMPGSGKTYLLQVLQKLGNYKTATYTNVSSSLIPCSRSLHSTFKINSITSFYPDAKVYTDLVDTYDGLIIDEISVIPMNIWNAITMLKNIKPSFKIFVFGDFNQHKPINDKPITEKSNVMKFLTDGNIIKLEYQYRSNAKYVNKMLAGDLSEIKKAIFSLSKCPKLNITLTKEREKLLNDELKKIYGDKTKSGSLIRLNKTCRVDLVILPKNAIFKVMIVGDDYILTQQYNGVCPIKIILNAEQYNKLDVCPGYAITSYKAQGITVNIPHAVHESTHKHFTDAFRFVAMTRTTKPELIILMN